MIPSSLFHLAIGACLLSSFSSCRKIEQKDKSEGLAYISAHRTIERTFRYADELAEQVSFAVAHDQTTTGYGIVKRSGDTIRAYISTHYGDLAMGVITIVSAKDLTETGSVQNIYFDSFAVANTNYYSVRYISGSETITNAGPDASGRTTLRVRRKGMITNYEGNRYELYMSYLTTQTSPGRSLMTSGYSTVGTGKLLAPSGNISISIPDTQPLLTTYDCIAAQAGTVIYIMPDRSKRILNYGDAPACDDQATLSFPSGKTYGISLGGG